MFVLTTMYDHWLTGCLFTWCLAGNIVAVDSVSPTVFVITEAGDLVKWFDCSDYMREPSDIAVRDDEYFVCDFKVSPVLQS